jgi:hypothetical protein
MLVPSGEQRGPCRGTHGSYMEAVLRHAHLLNKGECGSTDRPAKRVDRPGPGVVDEGKQNTRIAPSITTWWSATICMSPSKSLVATSMSW